MSLLPGLVLVNEWIVFKTGNEAKGCVTAVVRPGYLGGAGRPLASGPFYPLPFASEESHARFCVSSSCEGLQGLFAAVCLPVTTARLSGVLTH